MYLIFAGHNYYPEGGMKDFVGKFETYDECLEWLNDSNNYNDWYEFVTEKDLKIVQEGAVPNKKSVFLY